MKLRRILPVLLILCMVMPWLVVEAVAAETDIASTIEAQIRAFADSIDKKDADDAAASALARHGLTGRGKKLSVGKDHTLTATLLNSELLRAALTEACSAAIRSMQQLDLTKLENVLGALNWYGAGDSTYYLRVFDSADVETRKIDWTLTGNTDHPTKRNAYDDALDWIAGNASVKMEISRTKTNADTITYKISLSVSDRFDFAIGGNDLFKDMISGIGALLFKEFDWEAKVSFELEAPNGCNHSSGSYRWSYDPESKTFASDGTDSWQVNAATRRTFESKEGTITYYYELEDPVRLRHDSPWVMEYDVRKPGTFSMSPVDTLSTSQPHFQVIGRSYLSVCEYERLKVSEELKEELDLSSISQAVRHHHGIRLSEQFKFSAKKLYTFRLENQVNADGSNMVYLTVWDKETGEMQVDRIPMDDYYKYESWVKEYVLMDEENSWLSGKDLYINYIGNQTYRFSADHFELRIWENGEGGEPGSYYEKTKVTAPTCTTKGYTTYTCSLCGHSKKADYVEATGHSWSDWENISENERQRSCTVCGETERETVSLVYGDANADGGVNALDLILLRQYLAGWDVTIGSAADANGDGSTNALDLILLRQHLAGWDVILGQKSQNP